MDFAYLAYHSSRADNATRNGQRRVVLLRKANKDMRNQLDDVTNKLREMNARLNDRVNGSPQGYESKRGVMSSAEPEVYGVQHWRRT